MGENRRSHCSSILCYCTAEESKFDLYEWSNEKRRAKKEFHTLQIPSTFSKSSSAIRFGHFIFVNYFHFSDFLAARFTVCNDIQSFHTGHWLSTHTHTDIYYMRSMDLNRNIGIVFWPLIRLNVCVVMRKTKMCPFFTIAKRCSVPFFTYTFALALALFLSSSISSLNRPCIFRVLPQHLCGCVCGCVCPFATLYVLNYCWLAQCLTNCIVQL